MTATLYMNSQLSPAIKHGNVQGQDLLENTRQRPLPSWGGTLDENDAGSLGGGASLLLARPVAVINSLYIVSIGNRVQNFRGYFEISINDAANAKRDAWRFMMNGNSFTNCFIIVSESSRDMQIINATQNAMGVYLASIPSGVENIKAQPGLFN